MTFNVGALSAALVKSLTESKPCDVIISNNPNTIMLRRSPSNPPVINFAPESPSADKTGNDSTPNENSSGTNASMIMMKKRLKIVDNNICNLVFDAVKAAISSFLITVTMNPVITAAII